MIRLLSLIFFTCIFSQDSTLVLIVESGVFTIDSVDPEVEWFSPNGGESYNSGGLITVEWNAEDDSFEAPPISIYIASSIGGAFESISESTENDGSESLNLPDIDTWHARFKIIAEDSFGNSSEDYSDGYIIIGDPVSSGGGDSTLTLSTISSTFTIDSDNPEVEITTPIGGETYGSGAEAECIWLATDDSFGAEPVAISLATSIGGYFNTISGTTANDGSESISLPEINTAYARVRLTVIDDYGNIDADVSDGYFTIGVAEGNTGEDTTIVLTEDSNIFMIDSADPIVLLIAPNGEEEYYGGENMEITWEAQDNSFGNTPMDMYLNTSIGGEYMSLLENQANTGSTLAEVPMISTAHARLKVSAKDLFGNSSFDESEDYFYIIALGDVNYDGNLNILDLVIIANMILDDEYDSLGDMNEDNSLNILDLVLLSITILGMNI